MIFVAPFVGAWIEIEDAPENSPVDAVAPFVGAWIEIDKATDPSDIPPSRSLRGSVD